MSAVFTKPTRCFYIEGMGLPQPGWSCCKDACYNPHTQFRCKVCGHDRCEPLDPMPDERFISKRVASIKETRARLSSPGSSNATDLPVPITRDELLAALPPPVAPKFPIIPQVPRQPTLFGLIKGWWLHRRMERIQRQIEKIVDEMKKLHLPPDNKESTTNE
jgi:hypothetical protein